MIDKYGKRQERVKFFVILSQVEAKLQHCEFKRLHDAK